MFIVHLWEDGKDNTSFIGAGPRHYHVINYRNDHFHTSYRTKIHNTFTLFYPLNTYYYMYEYGNNMFMFLWKHMKLYIRINK